MKKRKYPRRSAAKASGSGDEESGDGGDVASTIEGQMPKKKFYRSRAHCNPLNMNSAFEYYAQQYTANAEVGASGVNRYLPPIPRTPEEAPWPHLYPTITAPVVKIVDVGCGFGGLTVSLAKMYPESCVLGMEIRDKVSEFVRLRIEALRKEHPGEYGNASVLRCNSMVQLPNFFRQGQLDKMFFCFPDPHFKAKNHRRRIISENLLTEYAHFMKEGALLYTITDVEDLHKWHVDKCTAHACFEPLTQAEMDADPCVAVMRVDTEEGKKVERSKGAKYWAVFRRRKDIDVKFSLFDE